MHNVNYQADIAIIENKPTGGLRAFVVDKHGVPIYRVRNLRFKSHSNFTYLPHITRPGISQRSLKIMSVEEIDAFLDRRRKASTLKRYQKPDKPQYFDEDEY